MTDSDSARQLARLLCLFFDEQQEIWNDVSRRWIEFRKLDRTPREDHPATTSDTH